MHPQSESAATPTKLGFAAGTEFIVLCVLLFALPTKEVPKQVAAVLYVLIWASRRFSLHALSRYRPDLIEMSLLAVIAASIASTAINWPLPNGIKGLADTLNYTILFWCIYRAGYDEAHLRILAYVIASGVLVGLAYGVFELLKGYRQFLEFHSAGIVTQSSVYLAIATMAAIGFAWEVHRSRSKRAARWFWNSSVLVMVCGLFAMGSRNALVAFATVLLVLLMVLKDRRLWYAAALSIVAATVLAVSLPSSFQAQRAFTKLKQSLAQDSLAAADLERLHIWRLALAHVKRGEHLVFGVGPRNFESIDVNAVERPERLRKEFKLTHAHQMYLNRLVEEGLFGLGVFLFFLALVATALLRDWRAGDWQRWTWIAAFGALLVPCIAGLFNGAFFNEQAILAMAVFGIYLSSRRRANTDFKVLPAA
jgi:O-antigen ligase